MPYSLEHLQQFNRAAPSESTLSRPAPNPSTSMPPFQRIALIGANGTLGPAILSSLLSANLTVTVLSRQSSKSTYPSSVNDVRIPDYLPTDALVEALTGQDALITAFAGSNADLQIQLADACVAAGVRRFIPADFGSCDSENERAAGLIKLYVGKRRVRAHLGKLEGKGEFGWTSVVCGHFFDWGLKGELLSFDLKGRKATVFDGGDVKFSASTLGRVGEAVVKVLEKGEEKKNRVCFVQSFCVSQNQVLKELEGVMGGEWTVESVSSEDFIKEQQAELEKDPKDGEAMERLVSVVGIVESNWDGRNDNAMLGLEEEDLGEVIGRVVAEMRPRS